MLALAGVWSYRQMRSAGDFFPRVGKTAPSPEQIQRILKDSEKRLTQDPENLDALVDQGVARFFMGPDHYSESLNALNTAWRMSAFDPRIFYYSGILYEDLSLFEESEKQYRRFLKHMPNDREVELRLARLMFRMGKWDESVHYYENLVKANPKDVTSTVNLGLAYARRYQQYQDELAKKPKKTQGTEKPAEPGTLDPNALLSRAIEYLEKASKLDADLDDGLYLELAKLYFAKGDWQNCVNAGFSELKRKSDDAETLKLVTLAYEKLGDKAKAYEFAAQWEKSDPKSRQAHQKVVQLKPRTKK